MSQLGLSGSNTIPISATAAAENYQLKWHSHVSNLNSSVCNLYKNDKYADVMLFTCNSTEEGFNGNPIPAHKLILGTCSHYFSSIFDNNPTMPINAMMYIVLPPDLSRRAVLTLIQYMYTGEATVSNDILQEVLKGGEILKIRGLCKVHSNNENIGPKSHPTDGNQSSYQSFRAMENGSGGGSGIINKSNKTTPRNSIDKKLPDSRSASHILTQQESPVIVMATSNQAYAQQIQQSNSQSTNNSNSQQQQPQIIRVNNQPQNQQPQQQQAQQQNQASTIIVKKDVAIDPGDNSKIPIEHYGLVSLQIAAAVKKAQQNNMKKMATTPMAEHRTPSPMKTYYPSKLYPEEGLLRYDTPSPTTFKIFNTSASTEQQLEDEILRYTEKKKRIAQNNKQMPCVSSGSSRENQKINSPKYSNQFQKSIQQNSSKDIHIPEALNFLSIKEEPAEWTEFEGDGGPPNGGSSISSEKKTEIITVKPETFDPNENSMDSETADKVYSPLTCELCNETFQLPADWVRHIESHGHTELTAQNIPKKRRRVEDEEESENIAALSCDLCDNIYFQSPAEWVRHVQNTHTETELAMSNNSILSKKTSTKPTKESPTDKACDICKKNFPSSASMQIHKRVHSGEKPFNCLYKGCNKGFNVKSNLLRHMRTLHNQINASNDNQDDSNSDNSMD